MPATSQRITRSGAVNRDSMAFSLKNTRPPKEWQTKCARLTPRCPRSEFIASARSTEAMDGYIVDIFNELGAAMLVDEGLIPAGTSLASCGIAYALRYIRAAMEGGVELGFRADDAKRIVMQTLRGAADILEAGGAHPEVEIDRVTTPGGLTIKGLNAMEAAGFTHSVIEGLRASTKR